MVIAGGSLYCLGTWLTGTLFPVEEVVVTGGEGLPEGRLESIIAEVVPRGTSLLLFDGRSLTRRLEAETSVAFARVRRRLPDTVILELVQREPLAILRQGEHGWVCDRDGVILEAKERDTDELPVVEVGSLGASPLAPGRRVGDEGLRTALKGIAFLRAASAETPERVCLSPRRGMEIKLTGGPWLRLGPPVRIEEKLWLCLEVLETSRESTRVNLVDVSCPDYSYYELGTR